MQRRSVLAAATATLAASFSEAARAYPGGKTLDQLLTDPGYLASHSARFIDLDTNSQMDLMAGYVRRQNQFGGIAAHPERVEFLKAGGYPLGDTELSYEQCHDIMMQEPSYAAFVRGTRTIHEMMWDRGLRSIYKNEDFYLSALEMTDAMGPGRLELNPGMHIPEYASYEIHEQPGGYVGNPFAGILYHLALASTFYHSMPGMNGLTMGMPVNQNQLHHGIIARWPTPPDGKVRRVLDVACGAGDSTLALREKYSGDDVEVWGIDVGGPMVRYAHHRAVQLGEKINFRQALAEKTGFPDGYFDVVGVNLLFHEVPSFAAKLIVPELQRITRPGGVWVGDASTQGGPQPSGIIQKATTWMGHRYNHETWSIQNNANDFPAIRKTSGWGAAVSEGQPVAIKV